MPTFRNGRKGGFEPGLLRLRVQRSTAELRWTAVFHPLIQHCRKVSYAMYDNLKQTLRDLEVKDIIRSVDKPTDWVHILVIVMFASVIRALVDWVTLRIHCEFLRSTQAYKVTHSL